MMLGFGAHRAQMLEAELLRMAGELPSLGARGCWLVRDLQAGQVGPETGLELLVLHETEEPWQRRPDFFVTHLRPRVATRFFVYTPEEFEALESEDTLIQRAIREGALIDGPR
jgi:hypothetical protein